jgi:hypothetical protein
MIDQCYSSRSILCNLSCTYVVRMCSHEQNSDVANSFPRHLPNRTDVIESHLSLNAASTGVKCDRQNIHPVSRVVSREPPRNRIPTLKYHTSLLTQTQIINPPDNNILPQTNPSISFLKPVQNASPLRRPIIADLRLRRALINNPTSPRPSRASTPSTSRPHLIAFPQHRRRLEFFPRCC